MSSDAMLSLHFSLRELTFSEAAARMGRDVEPTAEQIANAQRLCLTLLEPIRQQLGRPMTVLSGIRPQWLNEAIGGAPNSKHLQGLAADILVPGMSPDTFARFIRQRGFVVDQVISEFGRWTHIGLSDNAPRNQFLVATKVDGATQYEVLK